MPLHHTALEFKWLWGTAELQEVWETTEGRQDEKQSGRDRCRKEDRERKRERRRKEGSQEQATYKDGHISHSPSHPIRDLVVHSRF